MEQAFITPMRPIGSLQELQQMSRQEMGKTNGASGSVFQDVLKGVADNVAYTQQDLEQKQYLLTTGQLEYAHELPIASARAGLAVDLMVQLRNKAMDAYNEMMRISL